MAFPLTVELSTTMLRLRPGASSTFTVAISNTGTVVEHFGVTLLGLPAPAVAEIPVDPTKLRPKDAGEIAVTVALPAASSVHAGSYRLGVKVQSAVHPDVSRTAELTLEVQSVAGIAISAHPEVIEGRGGGTFTVTARNSGNSPAPLTLTARDETGTARISVQPSTLTVEPNASASATVTVRARGKLTGVDKQSRVTVCATDARAPDKPVEAIVRMVVNPLIPAGVSKGLGIVLVVGVAVASILVGMFLNRPRPPPPPPTPFPTAISTSSEGPRPPANPLLQLDPAAPVAGKPVTFRATVDDGVQDWAWELVDANGVSIDRSTQATFAYTFEPGNYQVKLVVTAPGGKAATQQPFVVTPEPAPVEQVSGVVELVTDTTTVTERKCPAGRTAVAGGVVDETGTSNDRYLRSGRPLGEVWRFGARSTTPRTVRYVLVCVTDGWIPGLARHPRRIGNPLAGTRAVRATCPAGTVVLGGGVVPLLPHKTSLGYVRESVPARDEAGEWTSWAAIVDTVDVLDTEVTVVCAPKPAGYEVVDQPLPLAVGSGQLSGVALCPGKVALGGGVGLGSSVAGTPVPTTSGETPIDPSNPGVTPSETTWMDILTSAPNLGMPGQMEHGWTAVAAYTAGSAAELHTVAICVEGK